MVNFIMPIVWAAVTIVWVVLNKLEQRDKNRIKRWRLEAEAQSLKLKLRSTKDKGKQANIIHDLSLLEEEARIEGVTLRPRTVKIVGMESCTKPSFWRAVKRLFCKDDRDK